MWPISIPAAALRIRTGLADSNGPCGFERVAHLLHLIQSLRRDLVLPPVAQSLLLFVVMYCPLRLVKFLRGESTAKAPQETSVPPVYRLLDHPKRAECGTFYWATWRAISAAGSRLSGLCDRVTCHQKCRGSAAIQKRRRGNVPRIRPRTSCCIRNSLSSSMDPPLTGACFLGRQHSIWSGRG